MNATFTDFQRAEVKKDLRAFASGINPYNHPCVRHKVSQEKIDEAKEKLRKLEEEERAV